MTFANADHQIAATIKRRSSLPVLIVLVAAIVMYIAQFALNDFYIGTYTDDANYIILAESIAKGRGYRQINDPDAPLETRYPPGYPAVLAPMLAFGSANLNLLKLPSVVTTALAVWLVWKLLRDRESDRRKALLALGLFSLNPLIVGHSVAVMSEGLFLVVLLLAAWAIERSGQSAEANDVKWPFLAAFLAATCALVRTAGWLLLPTGLLNLATRRRWRSLLTFAVAFMVLMLPWTLRNYWVTGALLSGDYQEQLTWQSAANHAPQTLNMGVLAKRAFDNLGVYASIVLPEAMIPRLNNSHWEGILSALGLADALPVVSVLMSVLIASGLLIRWRTQGLWVIDWFTLLYTGLLLIWPFVSGRFLHPLIPALSLSLIYGLESGIAVAFRFVPCTNASLRIRTQRVTFVLVLLLTALYLGRDIQMILNPLASRTTNLTAGADYIRQNASDDAIVMVPHPMAWYVHLHRKTVSYPSPNASAEEVLLHISRSRATYILIAPPLAIPRPAALEPHVADVLLPLLQNRPNQFQRVFEDSSNMVAIYEVHTSAP